jgi:acyl-CoA synthetase (AMP-forming)/AMP-acid ligase II
LYFLQSIAMSYRKKVPIDKISNIAQALADMAYKKPYQAAVIFPAGYTNEGRARFTQYSFRQLNELCDRYAYGLTRFGISQGERVLLLVRPGIELIGVTFALFKMGAVPVVIDPGMKRRAFQQCVMDAKPTAFIGIFAAHLLRILNPKAFRTVTHAITVGHIQFWGAPTIYSLLPKQSQPFTPASVMPESETAVVFTSGGTGIPKGVLYRQEMFHAQLSLLRNEIGIKEGEVDLPGLYIFALFGPALGVTEVFPDMDPTHPAEVDPAKLVQAIQTYGVTYSFGSPIIWRRVAAYCLAHGVKLGSLRRILMSGAPVPPALIQDFTQILEHDGEVYTPYGATEALPLTTMSGHEILADTAHLSASGHGNCVGYPVNDVTIKVIRITDDPIPLWDDGLVLPQGEVGEITAKGSMVTREYINRPRENSLSKIQERTEIWHRMGDLGYFDEKGRLWFCGRKSHRIETKDGLMVPVPCEAIFNQHPAVQRSALVGIGAYGQQLPVLVVEPKHGMQPHGRSATNTFREELLALGNAHQVTSSIKHVLFYSHSFPVDVRHNAKIDRLALSKWATKQNMRRVD